MTKKRSRPLAGFKGSILGGNHPLDDQTRQAIADARRFRPITETHCPRIRPRPQMAGHVAVTKTPRRSILWGALFL